MKRSIWCFSLLAAVSLLFLLLSVTPVFAEQRAPSTDDKGLQAKAAEATES